MPATLRWHVFPTVANLTTAIVEAISLSSAGAIKNRGVFHVVLAGGSTPQVIYKRLRDLRTDWNAWRIYFGDERHLPEGDPDRNDTVVAEAWLNDVPIKTEHVHRVPFRGDVEAATSDYALKLANVVLFDLVILGVGEDGHTASLFPGNDLGTLTTSPEALPVINAPKPPAQRVTMSAYRLSRARQVFFLVTGAAKRQALKGLREGAEIPAQSIIPPNGSVEIYADKQAAV